MGNESTTATAATAGAALGAVVGWLIAVTTGVDASPISGPLAVIGAFVFGRLFPR